MQQIKTATAKRTPLDSNVADLIKSLETERQRLQKDLEALPSDIDGFGTDKEKYIFIGETKAKLELYADQDVKTAADNSAEIAKIEAQIDDLMVLPANDRQDHFTQALDEVIQDYIALTEVALGNYGNYRSAFNYGEKNSIYGSLRLRRQRTSEAAQIICSFIFFYSWDCMR